MTPDIITQEGDLEKILYAPSQDMPVNYTKDELNRRNVDINMDIKMQSSRRMQKR